MIPEQLLKYLDKPENLNILSLSTLEEWIDKYPYFQTAHLLRVKNIHNVHKQVEKSILNHTAAYVTDRKVLYYLLHQIPIIEKKPIPDEEDISQPYEKDYKESLEENIHDTLQKQQDIYNLDPESPIELIPGLAIDIKKEYGSGIDLEEINLSLNNVETPPDLLEIINDPLDNVSFIEGEIDISEDIEEANFELEESTFAESPPESKNKDDSADSPTTEDSLIELSETSITNTQASQPSSIDTEEELYTDHSKSFTDWLDNINIPEEVIPNEKLKKEEIKMEIPYNLNKLDEESSDASPDEEVRKNKKDYKDSLVDQFIQTNPKIIPNENSGENMDFSADSVKEHESFFTDTLAEIYVKQGNYAKAILAYEKLCLKYPEKSTYFASQISEIKKKNK